MSREGRYTKEVPLRVSAIDFLNPAPLMWDFLHPPLQAQLAERYDIHFTQPSQCARELLAGEADLGLIPIAALTPELLIVPGCTIASLKQVRSIQLIVKDPLALAEVKTVAADTASRSSAAYAEVLLRHFFSANPSFEPAPASPAAMLRDHDAALLIGDPALLALENREAIEREIGPCTWYDVATLWREKTGLPWVAAVWALRADVTLSQREREQLFLDLNTSRKHGQQHTEDLVAEWTPKIALSPATIRTYLTANIHYLLDDECKQTILEFRRLAAEYGVLSPLEQLPMLAL
jgi:chorismate dehydratase